MSKQANKAMIGIFVVAALVLVISAIMIFGSGKFFKERRTFVMFFGGSVKGLDIGAPVTLQGVKVGTVTDIVLRGNFENVTFDIPVYVEFEPDRITPAGKNIQKRNPEKNIQLLIERGLRAQLQTQSFVTGKLLIELDFHPDTPIKLVGGQSKYPEIPTIPSSLEELSQKIEKLPIQAIMDNLNIVIKRVEKIANSPEVMASIGSLNKVLKDTSALLQKIDSHVDPLATGLTGVVEDTHKLVANTDGRIAQLTTSLEDTTKATNAAVEQAQKTFAALERTAGEDSPLIQELIEALKKLSDASGSINSVAEYIDRHPESLIRGKGGSK